MKKNATIAPTASAHRTELIKILQSISHRHDLYRVWSDFIEMSAIALSNAVDLHTRDEREERYKQIVGHYSKDEASRIADAFGALVQYMEHAEFDDVLGSVFMELELGNKWAGQFFTPYQLCSAMALLTIDETVDQRIADHGFIRVNDPAVGGGAMLIGMAQALKDRGHNYQRCMHATGQDLDIKAVHMAYVQLSLLHIPAVIIHGNTLTNEQRSFWFTPAHILGGWSMKLNQQEMDPVMAPMPSHQVDLFEVAA
jgi:type I restriction-modification system DNA methylase subunit